MPKGRTKKVPLTNELFFNHEYSCCGLQASRVNINLEDIKFWKQQFVNKHIDSMFNKKHSANLHNHRKLVILSSNQVFDWNEISYIDMIIFYHSKTYNWSVDIEFQHEDRLQFDATVFFESQHSWTMALNLHFFIYNTNYDCVRFQLFSTLCSVS